MYTKLTLLPSQCIAGYGGSSESQAQVWRTACASLLRRENLSSENVKSSGIAYLRAMCQFLMNIGVNGGLDQVLGNSKLSLCDRVAFACRFLPQRDLKMFLAKCIDSCQKSGDIEGLVITALSKPGIQIVQAFMDRHADVQTAALVVGRTILPPDWTMERKICSEWVEAYRGLLNSWQMWQSRAMFDVDRAELLRNIKTRSSEGVPAAAAGKGSNSGGRRSAGSLRRPGPRPLDTDILPSIPAQLDARCNYCSTPIGLKRHEGNANQWLSKMKPVLSCCPQCRKPLPRCAICLLSLGALNPYMELTRERGRGGQKNADDLSSLANMVCALGTRN
jgi:WD repeat-containing protein mio